jgi:hypothetical protein
MWPSGGVGTQSQIWASGFGSCCGLTGSFGARAVPILGRSVSADALCTLLARSLAVFAGCGSVGVLLSGPTVGSCFGASAGACVGRVGRGARGSCICASAIACSGGRCARDWGATTACAAASVAVEPGIRSGAGGGAPNVRREVDRPVGWALGIGAEGVATSIGAVLWAERTVRPRSGIGAGLLRLCGLDVVCWVRGKRWVRVMTTQPATATPVKPAANALEMLTVSRAWRRAPSREVTRALCSNPNMCVCRRAPPDAGSASSFVAVRW